jgi:serine/threonine protein kinase
VRIGTYEGQVSDSLVKFIRRRDFQYVRELGAGGCGRTVLLLDDVIDEHFVCKKYAPSDSGLKEELFGNFKTEIKLMHRLFHPNVVRIYGYHLEESVHAGYIVMEYVKGEEIDKHIKSAPETLASVFRQTVEAFCHLEECEIFTEIYGHVISWFGVMAGLRSSTSGSERI